MKRALIIGASGGIGAAFAGELRQREFEVTGLSRSENGLDFARPSEVSDTLAAQIAPFDLILVASGALTVEADRPEKGLGELSAGEMAAQFAVNTIGPALVLKEARRLLPRKGRSVFATLSARVGSIGDNRLGGWISYRAAKAALNQIVRTAAIEIARTRPEAIVSALHPGTVYTGLSSGFVQQEDGGVVDHGRGLAILT